MFPRDSSGAMLIDSLRDSLLELAEIGGNRLLDYDDETLARCRELQGRCVEIEIVDLDYRLYCHPGSWGVRLCSSAPSREVDACISGRLMSLLSLASQQDKLSTSIRENINLSGDVALARKLQDIVAAVDIDWEEALARGVGDRVAFQLHRRLREFGASLARNADSILQSSSEFLREEAGLSPTQVEFDRFRSRVGELRNDVARAEARLQRLLDEAEQR